MKPICLEIMGLNSFHEPQVIDFELLSETGVFGIFGPTGSGKSSILDALTLALYGTVERASNNTQGILNHAAQQLGVKFTFSLGKEEKKRIFRAERSYRRSGEKSISTSVCRLVEVDNGEESVLASKDKEMTKKIEDILGLNSMDFTRAVVLPQGKFAEFLTIKPKERREMLERLFALEAYGKELMAKLNDRSRNTEFELHGIEQRLQGLGNASTERLLQAEAEVNEAISFATAAAQQLEILRTGYDAAKEIWGLQEELSQIRVREAEFETKRVNMEMLRQNVDLAERAETIRPLIDAINITEKNVNESQTKTAGLEEKRINFSMTEEGAFATWKKANQDRVDEEPQILRKIERLEQAKNLENELTQQNIKLQGMRKEYSQIVKVKDAIAEELNRSGILIKNAQTSAQFVKVRLAEISVTPGQRAKVNTAVETLKAYQMLARQIEELAADLSKNQNEEDILGNEWKEKRILLQKAQEKIENLKKLSLENHSNAPGNEEDLSRRAQELERFRAQLANIERSEREFDLEKERLESELLEFSRIQTEFHHIEENHARSLKERDEAAVDVENQTALLKGLETQNLAGILAENLKENEPCPVCGSVAHPSRVHMPDPDGFKQIKSALAKAKETFEQFDQEVKELTTKKIITETQLSHIQVKLESQHLQVGEKEKEIEKQRELLSSLDRAMPIAQLYAVLAEMDLNIVLEREAFSRWKEAGLEINEKLEQAQTMFSALKDESTQIQAKHTGALRVGEDISNRLSHLRVELSRKKEELDVANPDIEKIMPLQRQYADWDLEAVKLNKELTRIEEELRALQEKERSMLEEKTIQDLALKDLEASGREAKIALEITQTKLEEITQGQPVDQLLLMEENKLLKVRKAEEESKKSHELAQGALNQVEQDFAVLTKELELNRLRVEEAREKLSLGLKEKHFITVTAAENALLEEDERHKMAEEIKNFQQEEVLIKEQKQEVVANLKGRSINPEEWVIWPLRLKEAEQTHNQAMERRGAAQAVIIDLREKHKEWTELEGHRKSLSHRLGLIKTLQSVLKGNSFVEFIAEEQLINIAIEASERLAQLTNYRYALEVDSEGGFVIRDDANGGFRRPVSSLSGGETFLTSLALALSLSAQIQLRGETPLEFFFLDEGFGTLDASLLEVVMSTLEKLHLQNLTIGVISHVPELRSRLARRLIVIPAEPGGAGSRVKLEMA